MAHLSYGQGGDNVNSNGFTNIYIRSNLTRKRLKGQWKKWPDTTPPTVTVQNPVFLESREGSSSLRATWLGHACYHVEFPNGLRVLFDPVFETSCAPLFSFLTPQRFNRYTPAPAQVADIPTIDVVVISHSHYDHLSHATIKQIQDTHPNAVFVVPLGLKKWFNGLGISNAVELDWWDDIDITLSPSTGQKEVSVSSEASTSPETDSSITARISCLPCQHTSGRSGFDEGTTLWASWAVAAGGKSVYFAGDTGYRYVPAIPEGDDDYGPNYAHLPRCPVFKQIGQFRGPFDLGLIPIGAYDPRYLLSAMHANPFDSVEIFKDTQCRRAMGMHWGTWALSAEDVLEPPKLLKQALKKSGIPEENVFDVCDIGESREF